MKSTISSGISSSLSQSVAEPLGRRDQRTRHDLRRFDAHPLLDLVRADAARAEEHGRDAGGADEAGVGPVAHADQGRRGAVPARGLEHCSDELPALVDLERFAMERRAPLDLKLWIRGAAAVEQCVDLL